LLATVNSKFQSHTYIILNVSAIRSYVKTINPKQYYIGTGETYAGIFSK